MKWIRASVRLKTILTTVTGAVLIWLIYEKGRFAVRELQIKFAGEQVALFDEMVDKAIALADEDQVRRVRQYIEWYYPSGTKQKENSELDSIVESARRAACARIEAHIIELKSRTERGQRKDPRSP
jgi:hypothetical protein